MSSSECVIPSPPTLPPMFGRTQRSYLISTPLASRKATVECQWAIQHEDVHKASVLAQVCTVTHPREYHIKLGVQSIIQEGPTCGPVALAMLVATGAPTVHDILQVAKQRLYTNHGEMFSANNMQRLVHSVYDTIGKDYVSSSLYRGQLDSEEIRCALRNGASIMVAYPFFINKIEKNRKHDELIGRKLREKKTSSYSSGICGSQHMQCGVRAFACAELSKIEYYI